MNIPSITEAMIRQLDVDPAVYERGRSYFNGGMVLDIVQRGKVIAADVQGSGDESYAVAVVLSARGIAATDCSCPYTEEWGGVCKHIVAALLTCVHSPEIVQQRRSIAELIADLDAERLRSIIVQLSEEPRIAERPPRKPRR